MFAKPQKEHQWLDQLVGSWAFTHKCTMPDGTQNVTPGKLNCRSIGGLWLIGESSGIAPEDGPWTSVMTVGFDPAQGCYVGTFIGSMMANIWPYRGVLDSSGKRLPLESEGPKFDGSGIGKYRDTIELIDHDTWNFLSEYQLDDGSWVQFMEGKHIRE